MLQELVHSIAQVEQHVTIRCGWIRHVSNRGRINMNVKLKDTKTKVFHIGL